MGFGAAIKWFFKVLREGEPPSGSAGQTTAPPPPVFTPSLEPAIQLLGLLQKEGRLLDFLHEDIGGYSDAEVGAAVRTIHAGCRRALKEHATLEPVAPQAEGASITVPTGFDASAIQLTGEVRGGPPFRGIVRHRGWRVVKLNLPTVPSAADARIAAPAEVEVQ